MSPLFRPDVMKCLQVLDLLCSSFQCGGASLVDLKGNIKAVSEELNVRQSSHGLEDMLQDIVRSLYVQAGHFFGSYWSKNKRLRRCVMAALGCTSEWCINSRAMQHLLRRGPAPATADLVERILRKFDANSDQKLGQGPAIPAGTALRLQFDVAVHIRTQARQAPYPSTQPHPQTLNENNPRILNPRALLPSALAAPPPCLLLSQPCLLLSVPSLGIPHFCITPSQSASAPQYASASAPFFIGY